MVIHRQTLVIVLPGLFLNGMTGALQGLSVLAPLSYLVLNTNRCFESGNLGKNVYIKSSHKMSQFLKEQLHILKD